MYHKHLLKVYCDVFYTSYVIGTQLKVLTVKKQIFKFKQLSKIYSMRLLTFVGETYRW